MVLHSNKSSPSAQLVILILRVFSNRSIDSLDFPTSRKFHSVLPFRSNQVIMFGGASFNPNTGDHVMVNDLLWTFNFEKFEWNTLPSLKMPRATFFHAGTMNEVKGKESIRIRSSPSSLHFSVAKFGCMEASFEILQ